MNDKNFAKEREYHALKVNDVIEISPFYGRKRTISLKGTQIELLSNPHEGESLNKYIIPSHLSPHCHYQLITDQDTYRLRVVQGPPFLLNGSWALDAFLFKGDEIQMLEAKWKLKGPVLTVEDEYIQDQSVVESDMKILITGESGTGKTRLAKKIHSQSKRSGQFIGINLSAYNPSLIESELFGHKKGAFTGAVSDKCGAFKLANWGTLFLDEIDSLPIELQTKLLGFLDDKTFRAVGDTREEKINARLIFASGRPLESLVEKGLFRKDFYYRLKTGHGIELKPLRDDVSLIDRVLDQFCLENNITLTYRLREFYLSLSWPGNLRELYGHLEKKRILTKGRKFDFDLCDEELITKSTDLYSFEKEIQSLEDTKREYVSKILGHFQGNYQLAAKKLLITEKTLRGMMKKAS